jgi:hypothetical protein
VRKIITICENGYDVSQVIDHEAALEYAIGAVGREGVLAVGCYGMDAYGEYDDLVFAWTIGTVL